MDLNTIAPVEYPRYRSSFIRTNSHSTDLDISIQQPSDSCADSPAQHLQVITSLIDSLSILAAATPESQEDIGTGRHTLHPTQPSSHQLFQRPEVNEVDQGLRDSLAADDSGEGEVAAAPVIPYARRPPVLSKKLSKSRFFTTEMSQPSLAPRDSMHSLKSRAESDSVGVPSIERPHRSSESSSFSVISGMSGSLRKPTTESLRDKALSRPIPPTRLSSDRRWKTESLYSTDQEKENKYPARSSLDSRSPSSTQLDQASVESTTVKPTARLSRTDLGSHMIPSRRSSLRRSMSGLQDTSPGSGHQSVRNLTDLNIDSELIDGDDSTVRRIRELQEAREKRQKEWRHEARKAERAAKRHSIATPKVSQRGSPYPSSRLSVTEVVVESPEVESPPELSACVSASDLVNMPALVHEPEGKSTDIKAALSSPPNALPSRANSVGQSPASQPRPKVNMHPTRQGPSLAEQKTISEEVEAFLGAPRFSQKIRHPRTGQTIAFSEVGDPQGFVVFCCVGMGLTRYLTAFYDELARTLRLRLITPDRPGVGESTSAPEASCTPLNWVDNVAVICSSLGITRFSLLAHSAGAIYAMAAALKMPQYVRGRIHLLAPWIPPSQMPKGEALGQDSRPIANLPLSHKILSVLPSQILKVANSRFLTATSASIDAKPLKSAKKNKQLQGLEESLTSPFDDLNERSLQRDASADMDLERPRATTPPQKECSGDSATPAGTSSPGSRRQIHQAQGSRVVSPRLTPSARQALYNQTLAHRIWALATQNANPAIDLVVCLERRRTIGFRYPEVTRSVVIHHGAKDTRVPLDNVRWLQSVMKRCELRVLDGEGHGLMASASAMAAVLGEISKEWEEWEKIARGKEKRKKDEAPARSVKGRP